MISYLKWVFIHMFSSFSCKSRPRKTEVEDSLLTIRVRALTGLSCLCNSKPFHMKFLWWGSVALGNLYALFWYRFTGFPNPVLLGHVATRIVKLSSLNTKSALPFTSALNSCSIVKRPSALRWPLQSENISPDQVLRYSILSVYSWNHCLSLQTDKTDILFISWHKWNLPNIFYTIIIIIILP